MTRTDVHVGGTEVIDAFHDDDRDGDGDAVEVTVGVSATIGYGGEAGTITLDGYEAELDGVGRADVRGDPENTRAFKVRLNGEIVAEGLLNERTSAAVTIETTGGALVELPPNQPVEIDVYGEEADN